LFAIGMAVFDLEMIYPQLYKEIPLSYLLDMQRLNGDKSSKSKRRRT
jgi:hypothetical protein